MAKGEWNRCTPSKRCPICNSDGFCSVSPDGRLCGCMRQQGEGYYRTDPTGVGPCHMHNLKGDFNPATWTPPAEAPKDPNAGRASPEMLDRFYRALLKTLPLSAEHRQDLVGRGLPEQHVLHAGYRTYPLQKRSSLAKDLFKTFGQDAFGVPGFFLKKPDDGKDPYHSLAGSPGLLIPVQNVDGQVVALRVRRDDDDPGKRYNWISSQKYGGVGPGAPVHVPMNLKGPCPIVRLTEGELKADVAFLLSGLPTIAIAGVGTWPSAIPVLQALEAGTVRLAFDADKETNPDVANALIKCAAKLKEIGFAVECETWPLEHGKGIDDVLKTGHPTTVLTGDEALAAIAACKESSKEAVKLDADKVLEDLAAAIKEGGAEAFFADEDLLKKIAILSLDFPPQYAIVKLRAKAAKINVKTFDEVMKPLIAKESASRKKAETASKEKDESERFPVINGGICECREISDEAPPIIIPICNFDAWIVDETVHDDGAETFITFGITGQTADGKKLQRIDVRASEFCPAEWVLAHWGSDAKIWPGKERTLPVAVQDQPASSEKQYRTVYGHTGWKEIDGKWIYLHAGGGIGAEGLVTDVQVKLQNRISLYNIPQPPEGEDLHNAIRASLRILDLCPDRISFTVLAAVFRSVLGPTAFSLHLSGPTGAFKSQITALAQQHFGSTMDSETLPETWKSTGNAIEGMAFTAKDALMAVDDFVPSNLGQTQKQALYLAAEQLFRGHANGAGRNRLRPDATLRQTKWARATPISTGEAIPIGHSLQARLIIIEIAYGDITSERLTPCQVDAENGMYVQTMAAFLKWVARQYPDLQATMKTQRADIREELRKSGQHARTPVNAAELILGIRIFLMFAKESGAIDEQQRLTLRTRSTGAITETAGLQTAHHDQSEPTEHFLRLLDGVLSSGRGHIAGENGDVPDTGGLPWGWSFDEVVIQNSPHPRWRPEGKCLGWIAGEYVYLQSDAAFTECEKFAKEGGETIPSDKRTLYKLMKEKGMLGKCDKKRNDCRKDLAGKQRRVVPLKSSFVKPCVEVEDNWLATEDDDSF